MIRATYKIAGVEVTIWDGILTSNDEDMSRWASDVYLVTPPCSARPDEAHQFLEALQATFGVDEVQLVKNESPKYVFRDDVLY